jgi:hypothetical protein
MDYSIDTGLFANNMLPPDKRTPIMQYWVKTLLSAMAWLNHIALGYYLDATGLTPSDFAVAPTATYVPGDFVLYQHAVYRGLYPDGSVPYTAAGNIPPGTLPTNTGYYVKVLPAPGVIGVNERILYNGNTLTLTWALNRYFNTVFRQPATGQNSDIYIVNFDNQFQSFIVGATEADTSAVAGTLSSGYVLNELTNDPLADFAIFIPQATFDTIIVINVATGKEQVIRAFIDKYVISGINYTIHTY